MLPSLYLPNMLHPPVASGKRETALQIALAAWLGGHLRQAALQFAICKT
jgi:hypothetical protein